MAKKKSSKRKITNKKKAPPSFAEFYEVLQTPIFVISKEGKFVYSNSPGEMLCGYSWSELSEMNIAELFKYSCKKKVEVAKETIFAITDGGQERLSELKLNKKSGRKVYVDFGIKYLEFNKKSHAIVTIHDLTEVKQHQREKETYLKELNHMSKLADIGRLTAGVAHELNNPLMIIQGFAENIQLMFEDNNFEKKELLTQVDPIVKATDRMSKIIATMMKMARDDDVYMVHVDMVEIIEDALLFAHSTLVQNKIEVIRDFRSSGGVVKCDPNQVEQIVLNIVNNAVHALEVNDVGERKLIFSVLMGEENVELRIKNNGDPIPDGIRDRIMSPFFTTKPVGEGTGLGLSLSYGIMKAHDGNLSFESNKEFTEFCLSFPKSKVTEGVKKVKSKRKILVVDDEKFIRDLIRHKLNRFGYEVYTAGSGAEGLMLLDEIPGIECVFTDIRMPNMDGTQFIKEIKRKNENLLVYAISGYAGKRSLEAKVKNYGISGFLQKPIDHMLFSKTVNEIEESLSYFYGKEKKSVS